MDIPWTALAQGNANIAYSNGMGAIMRVPKDPSTNISIQLEYTKVISNLLGNCSIFDSASIVKCSDYTLSPIPDHKFGLLMDDVTFQNDFTVELKPKSAMIDLVQEKRHPCLYCMFDYTESGNSCLYCPFMLYSNDEETIRLGLEELLNNPKKHFKVHHGGKVYKFKEAIAKNVVNINVLDSLASILIKSEILQKIKAAQKSLHQDLKDIVLLYEKINPNQPSMTDVRQVLTCIKSGTALTDVQKITSYLMSRSLRDLSLMLSFHKRLPERNSIKGQINSFMFYTIDVLDLDMKPISKIAKYYKDALNAASRCEDVSRYCTN